VIDYGDYAPLPDVDALAQAVSQTADAMLELERPASEYLRWPWPELDAVTGPLGAGGVVWFVCAFSGIGKTTFTTSLIEEWRALGKRVYVMPLETRAKTFRTHLACVQAGVYPGGVLSGADKQRPDWESLKHRVVQCLRAQRESPFLDTVMISEQTAINVAGLERGLMEAKSFGADVVIVDHIDHIEGAGDGKNLYAESKAVNHAALTMAQDNGMTLLFTSQLNLEIAKGTDHLAKFGPPRDSHVLMGNTKRQIATGMIGLFRKPRDRKQHETDDEYLAALKDARAGKIEPPDILDPNVMGVVAMKLRHFGAREGRRVFLGFEHGKVVGLSERDHHTTRRS
jgi:replicative DNA helicase